MNYKQNPDYFNDAGLFADLDYFGITNSTVSYLLNVKEIKVWQWRTDQARMPEKYRKKLLALIKALSLHTGSQASL